MKKGIHVDCQPFCRSWAIPISLLTQAQRRGRGILASSLQLLKVPQCVAHGVAVRRAVARLSGAMVFGIPENREHYEGATTEFWLKATSSKLYEVNGIARVYHYTQETRVTEVAFIARSTTLSFPPRHTSRLHGTGRFGRRRWRTG